MVYKYYRAETGESEEVEKGRYAWQARYSTGEVIYQYAPDGSYHQSKEIDTTRGVLLTISDSETGKEVEISVPPKAKIVAHTINTVLAHGTPDETRSTVYHFGYTRGNKSVVFGFYPNGDIKLQ